ncbi:MAG: prolyl oligopeptidase family serine peptidase [Acidobacteriota bacterium]
MKVALMLIGAFYLAAERPTTKKVTQVDYYHGVPIEDPYRWLEDDRSAETAEWVRRQNAYTDQYWASVPFRAKLGERLKTLMNYPKLDRLIPRGDLFYTSRNSGLDNQSSWFVQKGLHGKPELILNPNTLSTDGTVAVSGVSISKDGRYLAYQTSSGGSDWRQAYVMDLRTKKLLPEKLEWLKFTELAWFGPGFFYSRYPAPEKGKELTGQMKFHRVYYHRAGTSQEQDELVYESPSRPLSYHNLSVTEDERFGALEFADASTGKKGNGLLVVDLRRKPWKFVPVAAEMTDDTWRVVEADGENLLILTTAKAPRGQILKFGMGTGLLSEKPLVHESEQAMEEAWVADGKLFVSYSRHVVSVVERFRLDGAPERPMPLPGVGTLSYVVKEAGSKDFFYLFSSFNSPPSFYRYSMATVQSSLFFSPAIPGFQMDALETKQVFVTSKDGTKVPMFLIHKRGLKLDGGNPTLLYGYGGFAINVPPTFNSLRLALLEQGFVYASVNLRGGLEYGEAWHEAGTKLKKQNVFDDCIAASEWLIAHHYTNKEKLALTGTSNGGLLVGAVINQRPDLFRAALPNVGVMDMLRFHKFTAGAGWIGDYGSADNSAEFRALFAYSPLHNIRAGQRYPSVMVTTADHDDRVVPAHSFKYAATLQEKAAKERPALIRIETMSGHGASNLSKSIELTRDMYSFLMKELGVEPRF